MKSLKMLVCGLFAVMFSLSSYSFTSEIIGEEMLPQWTRDKQTAWTQLGLPSAKPGLRSPQYSALFSIDGFFEPKNSGPSAKIFVYDPSTGELFSLTHPETKLSLEKDYLPIVYADKDMDGFAIHETTFAAPFDKFESGVLLTEFSLRNKTAIAKNLELWLLVTHYSLYYTERTNKDRTITIDQHAVYINGKPFLHTNESIAKIVAQTQDGIMVGIPFGISPEGTRAFRFALPIFDLERSERLLVQEEISLLKYSCYESKLRETTDLWEERLSNIKFPAERLTRIAKSQAVHLLIIVDDYTLHGGPTKYDSFWNRDGLFELKALLSIGEIDTAEDALATFAKSQLPSGEMTAILAWEDRIPDESQSEWDANGEAIDAFYSVYTATEDENILKKYYPAIKKAALFQETLMAKGKYGIFPPSWSLEDIGSKDEQHFCGDNCPGIMGFREAAEIARILYDTEYAERFKKDEKLLEKNLRAAIKAAQKKHPGLDYIPNNDTDVNTSSSARGTSFVLYPTMALPPDDPLVKRSLDIYYKKWIAPSGGGFVHGENEFWPYAGLILAHDYLIVSEHEKNPKRAAENRRRAIEIFEWTMSHQTIPGLFVWGENIDRKTLLVRKQGGDMPHPTTAAVILTLMKALFGQ